MGPQIQPPKSRTGDPFHRSDLFNFGTTWFGSKLLTGVAPTPPAGQPNLNPIINAINGAACPGLWDHLIYAYMIENTRIYEIFRRVVHEFLHGEKLGVPGSARSQRWLRTTEELFYRDPPPFFIAAVTGYVRPDIQATRRNAYQRMFGMDLNHGPTTASLIPMSRRRRRTANLSPLSRSFSARSGSVSENVNNTSGGNPKDDAKIADLAERLHEMLRTRRETGNLSREEFVFVSMDVLVPPDCR